MKKTKKVLIAISAVLAAALVGVVVTGCSTSSSSQTTGEGTTGQGLNLFTQEDDVVCYYGCPNSKRVKRLNTAKKIRK